MENLSYQDIIAALDAGKRFTTKALEGILSLEKDPLLQIYVWKDAQGNPVQQFEASQAQDPTDLIQLPSLWNL